MKIFVIFLILLFLPCHFGRKNWKELGQRLLKDRNGMTKGEQLQFASQSLDTISNGIDAVQKVKKYWDVANKVKTGALGVGSMAGAACNAVGAVGQAVSSLCDFATSSIRQRREQEKRKREDEDFKKNNAREDEQDVKIDELTEKVDRFINETDDRMMSLNQSLLENQQYIKNLSSSLDKFGDDVKVEFNKMKSYLSAVYQDSIKKIQHVKEQIARNFLRLDDKIRHSFLEMNQLSVHLQFTEEILLDTDLLDNLMVQVMNFKRNDTIADFIRQYMIKGPRRIILDLTNRLKYKYTNPIISAMELHIFNSRKIIDFWRDHIGHIIQKLLIIEGFYYGLVELPKNTSYYYLDPCNYAIDELFKELNTFSKNLNLDPEVYWPHVIGYNVEKLIARHTDRNEAADEIQKLLDGIYTNDVFTIHVAEGSFNATSPSYVNPSRYNDIKENYFYAATNNTGSLLTFYTEKLAVSIVRSVTHHTRTENEMFLLNSVFHTIKNEVDDPSLLNRDRFNDIVDRISAEMEGNIGGIVFSQENVVQRITNEEYSALDWYNQVSLDSQVHVNVMWI